MSTIHEKLVAIQSELKAPKGQTNAFGKYKYRSCEDILEALKPLLKEQSMTLLLSDEVITIGGRFYVKATATVWGTDKSQETPISLSVTAYAREEETKKGMDGAQITGAASSYARKYALNGLFCIDDTKDADTMDNTKTEPKVETATDDQCREISCLCAETGTDYMKLKEHFKVSAVPTKAQAQTMIAALKAKLSKQLDSASSLAFFPH